MTMTRAIIPYLSAIGGLLQLAQAQCNNLVASFNPTLRTQSANETWFLLPINKTAVQQALDINYFPSPFELAPVPVTDSSLFPEGFGSEYHPVLVSAGYTDDIRMSVLQIDGALLVGSLYVPWVRRINTTTVLTAPLSNYLSGPNGNPIPALVPATVSTDVEGFTTRTGGFTPNAAAYQLGNTGIYSNRVNWPILPNPVSGPGVVVEAYDFEFKPIAKFQKYTAKLFKTMLNQPSILTGVADAYVDAELCQRNQFYFNNATSTMMPRTGNITLGAGAGGILDLASTLVKASPDGSGLYVGVEGFSACGQNVGFNPEDCGEAAENVDQCAITKGLGC